MKHSLWMASVGVGIVLLASIAITSIHDRVRQPRAISSQSIRGSVVDENDSPVVGARVRWNRKQPVAMTDEDGAFAFAKNDSSAFSVTAWKEGYLIGEASTAGDKAIVQLCRLPAEDDPEYEWVDPRPSAVQSENCGNCHTEIYEEWRSSGHADSAENKRFTTLYEGTDWSGHRKVGWSLRDEHPLGVGVCAACHAPGINFEAGASDDMRDVSGVASRGVHCDFCHKVQGLTNTDFGLTHGRFGFQLLRPAQGQLFFGPLDDVSRGEDTYSPLQHESQYCASCHEGVVFGTHVYSTYSEWLDSPARQDGKSCQSCHMAPTGRMTNVAPDVGGFERDPATLASHTLLPGGRKAMLRRSLDLEIEWETTDDNVDGHITLTARDIGHRLPTGFIDRHLILVVEAFDSDDRPLALQSGDVLPMHAGQELTGLPGRLFAKVVTDGDSGSPRPFWSGGKVTDDTRLVPEQPVSMAFTFPQQTDRILVRVLYRRFWKAVADQKQWPDDTITIHDRIVPRPAAMGAE